MNQILSPAQCRAARALTRMKIEALADVSGVSPATIKRFEPPCLASEISEARSMAYPTTLRRLRAAIELAGVILVDEGDLHTPGGKPRGAGVVLSIPRWLRR